MEGNEVKMGSQSRRDTGSHIKLMSHCWAWSTKEALKKKGGVLWVRNGTTEVQLPKGVVPSEDNTWSPGRGFLERRGQDLRKSEDGG